MIPETGEDEEYESGEDLEVTKDDELTDELAARIEAAELRMLNQKPHALKEGLDDGHAWWLRDFTEI